MTWALMTGRMVLWVASAMTALAVIVLGSLLVGSVAEYLMNGEPLLWSAVLLKALVAVSAAHAVNIADVVRKRTAPKETDR